MKLVLVKLGGSLITEKTVSETPRTELIARLSLELAHFLESEPKSTGVLLGHGSGSFGHQAAGGSELFAGVGRPLATDAVAQSDAASRTQAAAARLHRIVVDSLVTAGVPVFSWTPGSFLVADDGIPASVAAEPLRHVLARGMVPTVYGDVVTDRRRGLSICSTETVLLGLLKPLQELQIELLGALWLGETPGILGPDSVTVQRMGLHEAATSWIGATRGMDVTGGMAHRIEAVRRFAESGVPSVLFDGRVEGGLTWALERLVRGDWSLDPRCTVVGSETRPER